MGLLHKRGPKNTELLKHLYEGHFMTSKKK